MEELNLVSTLGSIGTTTNNHRIFYITEDIDSFSIQNVISSIIEINKDDENQEKLYSLEGHTYSRKPITIYVNSYGGSCYDGLSLIGVMATSKTPIHTVATGKVMSMGFAIAISGHIVAATKYTTFMVHSVSSMAWGQTQTIEESLVESRRIEKVIFDLITSRTSITPKKLKKINKAKQDWYFDENTALALDVIHKII